MPWKETCAMKERIQMIGDYLKGESSITAISIAYGVSRKTVYKWIKRFLEEGPPGLQEHSKAPRHQAHAVSPQIEQEIKAMRKKHPRYGPKKIRVKLEKKDAKQGWPAVSTIGAILKRNGLVVTRTRKAHGCSGPSPLTTIDEANRVWTVDFKGDFYTGDGTHCYPLTVEDAWSRYLIVCQGLKETCGVTVRAIFERLFLEFGLPDVIRSDNGSPFASVGIAGLTRLSVWWVRLGIFPERIQRGKPQQNGRHERFHRTLREETLDPIAKTLVEQQARFDRFLLEYNEERPHEAIGQKPPALLYHRSPRPYGGIEPAWVYPETMAVRRVKNNGVISWQSQPWYVSEALAGENVGLEEIGDHCWRLCLGNVVLGELDTQKPRIVRATVLQRRQEGE